MSHSLWLHYNPFPQLSMGVQLLFLACVEALCDASVEQGKREA